MSIAVQNVTKLYGDQKALDNVSISVHSGQVVGFLGPNGAGKSTLMKIITGFIPPSQGTVEVNGVSIDSDKTDFRKFIGYLPENNPLYADMYVKEYLHFVAKVCQMGRFSNSRVKEMVELTGIGHEQNKKIGQLSKGYRQRVGLAQALLNRPAVLILDEPTSGLDPNQIVEIRNIIAEVGKDKTVMLSTHIMQEVEAMCQRVIIINKGNIVADGSTQEVLDMTTQKGHEILVEFTGKIDPENFTRIAGVANITDLGKNQWLIGVSQGDIRSEVFRIAVENSYTLIGMQQKSLQLQDVFKLLTAVKHELQ
jgi:ABC-2 type transport system ATP-binding protein